MGTDRTGLSRRGFLRASALGVGLTALTTPLLAACGDGGGAGGGVSTSGLAAVLPDHVPLTGGVKPDIPSVTGANGAVTEPGYLNYPAHLVRAVSKTPGAGGSYSAITPLWGAIPPAGNAYYRAVNKALGATIDLQPANGNTYDTTIPTLVAGDKLPDWIQLPSQWNTNFNVGALAATRFADLTPYLSGSNIRKYPNLAAISTGGWKAGAWEGKLYGLPCFAQGDAFHSALFYRKDVFDARGVNPDDVRSTDDLLHLGAELSAPASNVWAFDQLWLMIQQMFGAPTGFYVDSGKLVHAFESPRTEAALEFAYRLAKSGYMHPSALANDTSNKTQRFYSGNVLVTADGPGQWNVSDARQGQAANPRYQRGAFKLFSSDGSTPTIELGPSTGIVSYLNRRLSSAQIEECLRIADYLAAPFGSIEYQLINFGVEGVHWTKSANGPAYTATGQRDCSQPTYQFLSAPESHVNSPGYDSVTRGYCAWVAHAVKYARKPVFWDINATPPTRFSSASTAQQVNDIITQVTCGTKTVADFKSAVRTWKSSGGGAMVDWYQKNVLDKYGTGQ
ncbi:ABC transporter substrate-binding protein [Phaeacidiphilus oryzae]|uniref:ABC transporter substrate-binding protein n=1 Tax=Phaeacidiphilus oryzae TaxID=348818 RepID=UPI000559FCC4|nr:extracellular solute-binding protein [Phaeacidiphilus oryzae]